jgi:hypothetical protein
LLGSRGIDAREIEWERPYTVTAGFASIPAGPPFLPPAAAK